MNYKEKRAAYDSLKNPQYFEPDMALLKEKLPDNALLKRKYMNPEKHEAEALWSLLDVVSKEDVVMNRREFFKTKEQSQSQSQSAEEKDAKKPQSQSQLAEEKPVEQKKTPGKNSKRSKSTRKSSGKTSKK